MEEVAEKLNYDGYEIDPETGELVAPGMEPPQFEPTTDHLPGIMRNIRWYQRRADLIRDFQRKETMKINAMCQAKIEQIGASMRWLLNRAEHVVGQMPDRRAEFPGLGILRFQKCRARVNTDAYYKEMTPEEQLKIQNRFKTCFNHKVTVAPDLKVIMRVLEEFAAGTTMAAPEGFTIERKSDEFKFVPEGGV